jgi:indolepyruvate ferredoxin oxidoreductase
MNMHAPQRRLPSSLEEDRYELEAGEVFLTGNQALLRVMFDQKRRDRRAGLKTGFFVSGYPGSPLGGMDGALRALRPLMQRYDILHRPAQNEEFAATSLMGTQMLDEHPHPNFDGVVGFFYGKGPGVDRSIDAMKHGNFGGTSKHGAVVILSGEDHEAKSSSVPYQQEFVFEHVGIPVLYPASVAEFLEFGHHAIAMSRYSGCWVAMKLVAQICEGGETVVLRPDQPPIRTPEFEVDGKPYVKKADFKFFPIVNVAQERELYYDRHGAVGAYARANGLDRIVVRSDHDRLGIVAAGKSYTDARQALHDLGFDEAGLRAAGIRLLKLGLIAPVDARIVEEFAAGLDEVVVIEEKRDFLERQIGRILCNLAKRPRLFGKYDRHGQPLFPIQGGMDYDQIANLLGRHFGDRVVIPQAGRKWLAELAAIAGRSTISYLRRTPNFCSGCPHNIGTKLAEGQVAWGSPGCHIFAMLRSEANRTIQGVTAYGGEGMPWIGLSPYTSREHIVQNVGDGSLFHSSYLNIRYAISAGVSMTFKVLYNGAIANTGGQPPVSVRSVPQLANLLATEGVVEIAIVAKDRKSYRHAKLPAIARVYEPNEIEETLAKLSQVKGVTVLVYDGQCANERRRQQKRGKLPPPTKFTVVNEDVCENCGHCAEVSNCMSLQKVPTEFGAKTSIHQSSCNQDQSCLGGECPSFVTVTTDAGKGVRRPSLPQIDDNFPAPALPSIERPYHIYVPGVGGTGVITINAILAQAASLDGSHVLSFDQTGAAQKWGPVLSSLIVARSGEGMAANNVGLGRADLYLALDLLGAADGKNLMRCRPDRTAAVINSSVLPNAEMIRNVYLKVSADPIVETILGVCDRSRSLVFDARTIAENIFGDYMMSNMIAVGAAYQSGALPITAASIEAAIRLNRVQVEGNIAAFRAGRLLVHDRARLEVMARRPYLTFADRTAELARRPSAARTRVVEALSARLGDIDAETKRLAGIRINDLLDYQGGGYARRYVDLMAKVAAAERIAAGATGALSHAVARNLHKLMAYKDEYEVARLLTQATFRERALAAFDPGAKLYYNLQPPLMRAFGLKKKVALGAWFTPALKLLAAMRFVRGTPFDIFGYAAIRREERKLIAWYADLVMQALTKLNANNRELVREIAELPDAIRGYEAIKLRSLPKVRERAAELLEALNGGRNARKAA